MSRSTLQERSWQWLAAAPMRGARTPQEMEAAKLAHTHARLRRAGGTRTVIVSTPNPTASYKVTPELVAELRAAGVQSARERFFREVLGEPFEAKKGP
jgi:hypothetical protein